MSHAPHRIFMLAAALAAGAVSLSAGAELKASFLFALSDFNGPLPYNTVRLSIDRAHDEVYVSDGATVQVFNDAGMQIYQFGLDPAFGVIYDIAIDDKGEIYLLGMDRSELRSGPPWFIVRCNYRGEPQEKITLSGLPAELSGFGPNRLLLHGGKLHLVNRGRLLVVVADQTGRFEKFYDLAKIIGLSDNDFAGGAEIFGFNIDDAGNMLFTVPVLFRAFVVSPDGTMRFFGRAGGAPGRFGVARDIVADDQGRLLVLDSQRSVVMVFDRDFRFLGEFGGYGERPENLIRPGAFALGGAGKLYVSQLRNRGVTAFAVTIQ